MPRGILKNLNLLNLLLLGLLIVLARYVINPPSEPKARAVVQLQQKKEVTEDTTIAKNSDLSSSPAEFMVIADQNPFHPERKIPIEKKAEQPLPKPDFVLYGTVITDDLNIAFMEDLKSPHSTPGRGKRQVPLRIGHSLSGFTLKEIETDKVVMTRGDEKITVYLINPNSPKKRTPSLASVTPQTIQTPTTKPPSKAQKEQKETVTPSQTNQAQQPPLIAPPAETRAKPKGPLTPEQFNKARDAFLKSFLRE